MKSPTKYRGFERTTTNAVRECEGIKAMIDEVHADPSSSLVNRGKVAALGWIAEPGFECDPDALLDAVETFEAKDVLAELDAVLGAYDEPSSSVMAAAYGEDVVDDRPGAVRELPVEVEPVVEPVAEVVWLRLTERWLQASTVEHLRDRLAFEKSSSSKSAPSRAVRVIAELERRYILAATAAAKAGATIGLVDDVGGPVVVEFAVEAALEGCAAPREKYRAKTDCEPMVPPLLVSSLEELALLKLKVAELESDLENAYESLVELRDLAKPSSPDSTTITISITVDSTAAVEVKS